MSQFLAEVKEQPLAIRETVRRNEGLEFPREKPLLFTGMGSSLAASELAVLYLQKNGVPAAAIDNSELIYYASGEFLDQYEVVVVSQSGESYEARKLAERHPVAAITNTEGSTLAKSAKRVFFTHAGKEQAIASSKSFTATVALMLLLGAKLAGRSLAEELYAAADVIERELGREAELREQIASFLDPERPLELLGRGPSLLTARQGALTLKETARMYTEAMSAPQFRHGPFELIRENLQAVFFNPKGATYDVNRNYVLEMADLGARVLYVSDEPLEHERISSVVMPSVHEFVSPIPYSLVIQLAAVELSAKRGLVAGKAELISKVTGKE